MFRDGQYLEVIKISENCTATAIITIKQKSVEINGKRISTNKWLSLEDWSSLYKIIQRAGLRNSKISHENNERKSLERRKSTRGMDVIYSYEAPKDPTSLPTIKARVSPAKRRHDEKSSKVDKTKSENISKCPDQKDSPQPRVRGSMERNDEEYVPPDIENSQSSQKDLQYVPSRKSLLKQMRSDTPGESSPNTPEISSKNAYVPNAVKKKSKHEMYEPSGTSSLSPGITEAYVPTSKGCPVNCDEYTPTSGSKLTEETAYVPNPIASLESEPKHEMYEPWEGGLLSLEVTEAYVPSSMGSSTTIEEYQPDFSTMSVNSNVTYIPSATKRKAEDNCEGNDKKCREEMKDRRKYSSSRKKGAVNTGGKREL
ncbi:uncharacterized protein [Fopius arisanus]|uniref:Uncharacterized protein n=1 Tax=Fopius arisanus TaxID=64838 RepID=A0A9R1TZ16_9HYME|nr:PREDICTED: uncharacterized protein LOC105265850 [Fopius arisanus]